MVQIARLTLETDRVLLRGWSDEDNNIFARINSDPEVMQCMPSLLTKKGFDQLVVQL